MPDLVTVQEVKDHLRVGTSKTSVDTYLEMIANAAESWVLSQIGVGFHTEEVVEYLPGGLTFLRPRARLPICSVSEIEDTWAGSVIEEDDYRIVGNKIFLAGDGQAPSFWPAGMDRYKVTYVGGYNDGDDEEELEIGSVSAPNGLKLAVLALCRRAYEERGGVSAATSQGVNVQWDRIVDSSIMDLLRPFSLRPLVS